jgi:hypothetical protein
MILKMREFTIEHIPYSNTVDITGKNLISVTFSHFDKIYNFPVFEDSCRNY